MTSALESDLVLLFRDEAEDLKRRAGGKSNLILHIQSKEEELKKEKERNARLEEMLLDAYKRFGESVLQPDADTHEKTSKRQQHIPAEKQHLGREVYRESKTDVEAENPTSLIPNLTCLVSGVDMADGFIDDKTEKPKHSALPGQKTSNNSPEIFTFPHHPDKNIRLNNGQIPDSGERSPQVKDQEIKQTIENDGSSENNDSCNVHGVSNEYFDILKRELIKTKKKMAQLLRQKSTEQSQEQNLNNTVLQERDLRIKRLEEEVQNLRQSVQLHRKIIREQTEGMTVHSSSQENSLSDGSIDREAASQSRKSSGCQTSPILLSTEKKDSSVGNDTSDLQQMIKELRNRNRKLEIDIGEAYCAREKMKTQYEEFVKMLQNSVLDLKRKQLDDDQLKKLQELPSIQSELRDAEENNRLLLETLEKLQLEKAKVEKKVVNLEAELREEQRCHGLTKHNMYHMNGMMKIEVEKKTREKDLLQRQVDGLKSDLEIMRRQGGNRSIIDSARAALPPNQNNNMRNPSAAPSNYINIPNQGTPFNRTSPTNQNTGQRQGKKITNMPPRQMATQGAMPSSSPGDGKPKIPPRKAISQGNLNMPSSSNLSKPNLPPRQTGGQGQSLSSSPLYNQSFMPNSPSPLQGLPSSSPHPGHTVSGHLPMGDASLQLGHESVNRAVSFAGYSREPVESTHDFLPSLNPHSSSTGAESEYENTNSTPYSCDFCWKEFEDETEYLHHVNRCQND